ncbi:ester cyclase [Pseudoroseomonas ludipueritiae]|uniref:Ester cyclase n=1 Tax=Pseudoroseomonas ludipueritiae TaxID=198093 RepID=A0ABR7R8Y6_9PROT|nr:ester cyclase [Pseudoroseomonas ludipueritiae]MBC9178153.1 ester cyclase [Pseudoroseomonas ludipueritiae]MCG7361697.1 ester cyclase [Roseomonas sp. ACRSG]
MPSPGAIFRLWFEEVWNQRDASRIAAYLAPEAIIHAADMQGADARGPAGFQPFFEQFLENFSGIRFTVHEVIEAGDMAAGRWTVQLTHSGDGFGVRATGQTMAITGMSMIRVAGDQVVEGWNEWDRLRLATACRMLVPV